MRARNTRIATHRNLRAAAHDASVSAHGLTPPPAAGRQAHSREPAPPAPCQAPAPAASAAQLVQKPGARAQRGRRAARRAGGGSTGRRAAAAQAGVTAAPLVRAEGADGALVLVADAPDGRLPAQLLDVRARGRAHRRARARVHDQAARQRRRVRVVPRLIQVPCRAGGADAQALGPQPRARLAPDLALRHWARAGAPSWARLWVAG